MEIVKAFTLNELHTNITIKGTHNEPLFRASDIGLILEITSIRSTIRDFDETEKVEVHTIDTIGRNHQVSFLTEKGLYGVLFMSRKPIAKEFKGWVFEVIKEIRLTGEYKLNKENEELKKQLEEKDKETNTLIYQNQLVNHNKFLQLRDKDIPLFKKVEPNNFVLLQLLNSNTYSLVFLSVNSFEEYKMFENIIL